LVAQESELRQTVLVGLLRLLRINVARRLRPIAVFEVGPVMLSRSDASAELPDERLRLGVLVEATDNGLSAIAPVVSAVARLCGVDRWLRTREVDEELVGWPVLHPRRASQLMVKDQPVGVVGELHPRQIPDELAHLVDSRFGYLELDLELVLSLMERVGQIEVPSVYTASSLDLSFAIEDHSPIDPLLDAIRDEVGELCVDLAIFDRFVPSDDRGRIYVGVRLRLESTAGVIEETTIQSLIDAIDRRSASFGARLRRG
jgi:phenylalanyl-tRNA synthetase beta chain